MHPDAYSVWRLELVGRMWPVIAALLVCVLASALSGWTAMSGASRIRLRPLGTRGTSELEFALAFPIFLVSVLITVQIALMANANLVVDYAAFCAARSAAVWIPQDLDDEPSNTISEGNESQKRVRIRRAAVVACLPIAPRLSRFRFGITFPQGPSEPIDGAGLARLAAASDATIGGQVDYARLGIAAVDKWLWANYFTDVVLGDASGSERTDFGADGKVTARVTHKFEMTVPFAGQILGAALGERYLGYLGGYFVPLTSSYTLATAQS